MKRFPEPITKQPIRFAGFFFIILAWLYVGISFAERIQENSEDLSMIGCEMLCEIGPNFSAATGEYATMFENYSKYSEDKHLARFFKVFTDYRPEKSLVAASRVLGSAIKGQDGDQIANNVWRAGEEVMLIGFRTPKWIPDCIRLHDRRKISQKLLVDIRDAIEGSKKALRRHNEEQSLVSAEESCMANRKAIVLMFLVRNYIQSHHLFSEFQEVVKACEKSKMDAAHKLPYSDPRREFLVMFAQFDRRRFLMLEALKDRNMQKAKELMWESITIAYSTRDAVLELCANVTATSRSP